MNVTHHTFGTGTVVSETNEMVIVDFNAGRKTLLKKFANLTYEGEGATVVPITPAPVKVKKSRGEKKRARDAREMAAFEALTNLEKLIRAYMRINGKVQGDRNSLGYQLISERLAGVWIVAREKGDTKVLDILKSVEAYMRCSEKQAYCIAKFADDNGIKYEDDNQ